LYTISKSIYIFYIIPAKNNLELRTGVLTHGYPNIRKATSFGGIAAID